MSLVKLCKKCVHFNVCKIFPKFMNAVDSMPELGTDWALGVKSELDLSLAVHCEHYLELEEEE